MTKLAEAIGTVVIPIFLKPLLASPGLSWSLFTSLFSERGLTEPLLGSLRLSGEADPGKNMWVDAGRCGFLWVGGPSFVNLLRQKALWRSGKHCGGRGQGSAGKCFWLPGVTRGYQDLPGAYREVTGDGAWQEEN